jgi:hypothetical protein
VVLRPESSLEEILILTGLLSLSSWGFFLRREATSFDCSSLIRGQQAESFSDHVNLLLLVPGSVSDPDPRSGAFLTLDPGWVKNQDPDPGSSSGMNIPDHIFAKSFWPWIRDEKNSDP